MSIPKYLTATVGKMLFRLLIALVTLAASPLQAAPLKVAVVSDLNGSYGSTDYSADVTRAVERIIEMKPDLVISTGDMVAGQKTGPHLTQDQIDAMWAAFHRTVTDPLAEHGIPLLVTPGNHDASAYPSFELERKSYDRTWTEHSPDVTILDGERYPFRYAAEIGGALFISLDVTTLGPLPPEEMDWLSQILREEVPRHRATVVFGHLPIWPVAQGRENDIIGDPALQTLFTEAGVKAYLSGHHQAYYASAADGVLYLAQACLGGGPRKLLGNLSVSPKAITILEIGDDGNIESSALTGRNFTEVFDLTTLPAALGAGTSQLVRQDLAEPKG